MTNRENVEREKSKEIKKRMRNGKQRGRENWRERKLLERKDRDRD
jgi:hypothetical protein